MQTLSQLTSILKLVTYSFGLFLVQIHFISRLPFQALRVDLLLILTVGLALELPILLSISWAIFIGYVVDVFSGKFWGFHVGSYVVTVLLVSKMLQRIEMHNPMYQMFVAGLCALVQCGLLAFFLWFDQQAALLSWSVVASLIVRTMLMMLLAPVVVGALAGLWDSR
jgi:rod shape-determining protein MreD